MSKPFIFQPEDFRDFCNKNPGAPHDVCIALQANQILKDWLKDAPTVYGDMSMDDTGVVKSVSMFQLKKDTHKAKLVCIEPIINEDKCL